MSTPRDGRVAALGGLGRLVEFPGGWCSSERRTSTGSGSGSGSGFVVGRIFGAVEAGEARQVLPRGGVRQAIVARGGGLFSARPVITSVDVLAAKPPT
ncbi:hypothetical protein [Umezawaea sp.]|uniref:hypothetical protein n=1 Tax=Umezawaea sp. TaxID=1955258 RepID=UPI002ED04F58